ncbi:MAG: pilus assembly protein PilM [Phycisphaerales bacterium]
MLSRILHRESPPVGIEIGDAGVRMLQLDRTRSGYSVRAHGASTLRPSSEPLSPARLEEIGNAIREHVDSGRFSARECVLGLGGAGLRVRSVRQPRMPRAEADKALRIEAADRLGLNEPRGVQIGWIRAGDVRHGEEIREEVIVVGCERDLVERIVEMVSGAGLRPVAVEPSFCALARALGREHRDDFNEDFVRLVVEVGPHASTVLVLRGADTTFYKRLAIGGRDFDRVAAERLGLDPATVVDLRRQRIDAACDIGVDAPPAKIDRAIFDAVRPLVHELAEEVALCLRYYTVTFCSKRPSHALVVGEDAGEPGLVESLAGAMNLEGSLGKPLEGVGLGPFERAFASDAFRAQWGAALGLAVRRNPERGARRDAA